MLDCYPEMPKVALTVEDARRLPGDVTKGGDSRAAAFIEKYGEKAVELDALPPAELRGRIQNAVEERMDMDALKESLEAEREEREEMARKIGNLY